jgi:YggT family protein
LASKLQGFWIEFLGMTAISLILFFLSITLRILNFAVFARVIFSWLPHFHRDHNRFFAFLYDITEPVFTIVKIIPHKIGMIDISPLYAFFLLQILMYLVDSYAASFIS